MGRKESNHTTKQKPWQLFVSRLLFGHRPFWWVHETDLYEGGEAPYLQQYIYLIVGFCLVTVHSGGYMRQISMKEESPPIYNSIDSPVRQDQVIHGTVQ